MTACLNIETTLGTNARLLASGGNMFRIAMDTKEKYPWKTEWWSAYATTSHELICYEGSYDDIPVLHVKGLPDLGDNNWW